MSGVNSVNFGDVRLLGTLKDLDGNEIKVRSYLDDGYDDNIRYGVMLEAILTKDSPYRPFGSRLDEIVFWGYGDDANKLANGFVYGDGQYVVADPSVSLTNFSNPNKLPWIRTPGIANIYIADGRSERGTNRTIVHEILHQSSYIDNKAESLVNDYLDSNAHLNFTGSASLCVAQLS
jgi:hypothetical protein